MSLIIDGYVYPGEDLENKDVPEDIRIALGGHTQTPADGWTWLRHDFPYTVVTEDDGREKTGLQSAESITSVSILPPGTSEDTTDPAIRWIEILPARLYAADPAEKIAYDRDQRIAMILPYDPKQTVAQDAL